MRIISDSEGLIINLGSDEVTRFAAEIGINITPKAAREWVASHHAFLSSAIKGAIKADIARTNKQWP